jgi:ABC-type branched-subunit amino acid transport system substrate-binding protein
MRRVRLFGTVIVVMLISAAVAGADTHGTTTPQSTDIGVSATQIRVAVVADVDNPIYPGFFAGAVAGVQGAAKYLNAHGGIAGRKVVVDFIDSHLDATEARNAIIMACSRDFALVATSALFLSTADDEIGCRDARGAATGIPDLPLVTTEVAQQCSPVAFPLNPPNLDCSTLNDHPQTYRYNAAGIQYYEKKFGKLKGFFLIPNDLTSITNSTLAAVGAIEAAGVSKVGQAYLSIAATRPQFTPAVQQISSGGANYVFARVPFPPLRQEAAAQGVNGVKAWDCELPCYDPKVIASGEPSIEGNYVRLQFLPFNETASNPMLANFIHYTDPSHVDGYAPQAFAATLALEDAINAVVHQSGDNGVTRSVVLGALAKIQRFDADGMISPIDLGGRRSLGCTVVMQIKNRRFVRVDPATPGTFACSSNDVQTAKLNLLP